VEKKQTHRGRPAARPRKGEKVTVSIRATADLKERILRAAEANGVPFSHEIEARLWRSFIREELLPELMNEKFGTGVAGLLLVIGRVMRESGRGMMFEKDRLVGPDWMADPDAYREGVTAACMVLEEFQPEGASTLPPSKPSIGARYARDRISKVVNQGAPYPYGEKPWIDLVRQLLGPELLAQSRYMRAADQEDAKIMAARQKEEG
jgi:hypothetical protein